MNVTNPTALSHIQATHGKSADAPAFKARAAIEANPDLGEQSFGKIVSKIARGLPLEPAPVHNETSAPAPGSTDTNIDITV